MKKSSQNLLKNLSSKIGTTIGLFGKKKTMTLGRTLGKHFIPNRMKRSTRRKVLNFALNRQKESKLGETKNEEKCGFLLKIEGKNFYGFVSN